MKKNKQKLHFYSINTVVAMWFILIVCIVLIIVSALSYFYTINDMEKLSIDYTKNILTEINMNLSSYVKNVKSMTDIICINTDIQNLLNKYDENKGTNDISADNEKLKKDVSSYLNIIKNTRKDIINIAVISKYRDVVLDDTQKEFNTYSNYNLADWFLKPLSYTNEIYVSQTHVQSLIKDEYPWVISVSRSIIDTKTKKILGVVVIDINFFDIEAICESISLGKNGYIYIMDNEKNVIYHPQQQLIYSGIKLDNFNWDKADSHVYFDKENNRIYTMDKGELTDWYVIGVVDKNELIQNKSAVIKFYFFLGILSILGTAVSSFFISKSITTPILNLEKTMQLAQDGNLDIRASTQIYNEIGHLGKVFNNMIARIKDLMVDTVQKEEEKRKSEIKALQAQINPHFLYNTLDTIVWMAATGKNDEVIEATSALAQLFRTSISKKENFVKLKTELDNINNYLIIQKMRFADKIKFDINVDEDTKECLVPKLILQPLVENAIVHGIDLEKGIGHVNIGATVNKDMLLLTVSDNGNGMSEDVINNLFLPKDNDSGSIGITNVNNRIKLLYGENYGLHYFSLPNLGTRVEIKLPYSKG